MLKSNVLKAAFLNFFRIIGGYFLWMNKYSKHPEKYEIQEKYDHLRKMIVHINKGLNAELKIIGLDNIPNETSYFVSNHIGAADPIFVIEALEKPITFVCKKELEHVPFVTKCIKTIEGEFIDRDNLKASLRTMMKVEADLKKGRKNWLIFPEGTRNKDDHRLLLEFHHGTFRSAVKAQVPIVPICIYGSQRIVSSRYKLKKYPIYLEFGKPLYPKDYENMTTQDIADYFHNTIQTMLSYHARRCDRDSLMNLLGDKYNDNVLL